MRNEKIKILLIFTVTILLVYLLYYSKYLFEIVPPIIANGRVFLFGDWTAIVSAIKCDNLGINVFFENPCDPLKRIHVYGSIFLFLPTITKFKLFFFLIFPIIFILIFIITVLYLLRPFNLYSITIYFLSIFNPSTLLLFERFNFDLIIFLGMLLIIFINNKIFKFLTLVLLFSMKFWSIILAAIFLFFQKNKFNQSLIYIFFALILFSGLIYFEYDNLSLINKSSSQITASKYFIFGIGAFEQTAGKYLDFISIHPVASTYSILIVIFIFFFSIEKNNLNINYSRFDEKNFQLLILSSLVLTIMYFLFDNVYYREVFLIGCIPFFLKLTDRKYYKFLIYLIIFKYIILIFARIIFKELDNDILYIVKSLVDMILISNLMIIILYFFYNLYKKFFQLI